MRKIIVVFTIASGAMFLASCATISTDLQKVNNFVCSNEQSAVALALANKDNAGATAIENTCAALAASSAAASASISSATGAVSSK